MVPLARVAVTMFYPTCGSFVTKVLAQLLDGAKSVNSKIVDKRNSGLQPHMTRGAYDVRELAGHESFRRSTRNSLRFASIGGTDKHLSRWHWGGSLRRGSY